VLLIAAGGWLFFAGSRGGLPALVAGNLPAPLPAAGQAGEGTGTIPGGGGVSGAAAPVSAVVRVALGTPLAELPAEYLSVSIDSSQLVGGLWWNQAADRVEGGSGTVPAALIDLADPRLRALAAALAPAWLRVGGSEADRIYYDMDAGARTGPGGPNGQPGYRATLGRQRWDELVAFAGGAGLRLAFTINAGPGPRSDGAWRADNARALLGHAARAGQKVDAWEFGNELNGYWFVHGPDSLVAPGQYAADFRRFAELVGDFQPASLRVLQGSAFWPVLGEAAAPLLGFMDGRLAAAGPYVDRVNWHYYPQQSRRAPAATRRADSGRLLDPVNLDEAAYWASRLRDWRDRYAPGKPIWLGETGNAQFGGEPGLSDRYLAGLWWLDELGLMARSGVSVVVRQCLAGMDYGLLDGASFEPRPDYWNSLLWKRLMGPKVFAATVDTDLSGEPSRLRAYAQGGPGGICLLLINLDPVQALRVALPDFAGLRAQVLACSGDDPLSGRLRVNGHLLALDQPPQDGGIAAALAGIVPIAQPAADGILVAPLGYSFVWFGG
jgi:heparanase 1